MADAHQVLAGGVVELQRDLAAPPAAAAAGPAGSSTIFFRCSMLRAWNTMISSTRLRNSGRKCLPQLVQHRRLHAVVDLADVAALVLQDALAADVATS